MDERGRWQVKERVEEELFGEEKLRDDDENDDDDELCVRRRD